MKKNSDAGLYLVGALAAVAGGLYLYENHLQSNAKQEYWTEVVAVNNLKKEKEKTEKEIVSVLQAYSNSGRLDEMIVTCQEERNVCEREAARPASCTPIEVGNECPDLNLVSTYEHEERMDIVRCCRDTLRQANECLSEMQQCYLLGKEPSRE